METSGTNEGRSSGVAGALRVAACLAGVAAVLAPVVVKAVADALKDPEVQGRLAAAGRLLIPEREETADG